MHPLAVFWLDASSAFFQLVTPFTVTDVSRRFDAEGRLLSEFRFQFAVNRDGSMVSLDLDPAVGRTRQILDAANSRNILIDPKSRSVVIMPRPVSPRVARAGCAPAAPVFPGARVSTDKSAGTIHGVPVERISVDEANGEGFDMYMAPSLGCYVLRSVARRNGLLLETRVAEDLQIGDPEPALFEVPSDYRLTTVSMSVPK